LLEASTMKSRRGFAIQRLMNAMRQAHADGWFIVFDTLTLADDRLEAFYDNPNALLNYFRDIVRMVLAAEGRKPNNSHADCYHYFCETLRLADVRLEAFYDNLNALRDYFRDIGRMVLAAEGRKANDSHADCYQYFCVPEYGTANGRLHFHAVHFMRTLPTGSVDPNF